MDNSINEILDFNVLRGKIRISAPLDNFLGGTVNKDEWYGFKPETVLITGYEEKPFAVSAKTTCGYHQWERKFAYILHVSVKLDTTWNEVYKDGKIIPTHIYETTDFSELKIVLVMEDSYLKCVQPTANPT